MEIKYLSDGRKVCVIGKLNNIESIVQEVFVTETGDEVPSGERFITKSMHDTPVISYKEKQEKDREENLKKLEEKTKQVHRQYNEAYEMLKAISAQLKSVKLFQQLIPAEDLNIFTSFLTGTTEYVVANEYKISPPFRLIDRVVDFDTRYGEHHFDSLKLLSVLGKSEGKIGYWLHRYSDGSGGHTEVYPYDTEEEAIAHIKRRADELIEKDGFSIENYKACVAMGITFSAEQRARLNAAYTKSISNNIQNAQDAFSKTMAQYQETLNAVQII